MAGRGRGRGSLNRWDPGFDGRAIASVTPLKKHAQTTSSKMDELKLSSVRVTCIIDVNHFWAQLGSNSDLEHFDNYMFALNHWCDNQIPSTISDMPNVGQVVCVQHAASRMWRRAEVTRLSQRMVDVFFLDYGEAECVSLDMLCSNVPTDITSWPPQALYCTLDGVQPPKGEDQWSEKAVKRFRELVSFGQQNLAASHGNGSLQLTLYLVDENGHMKSVGSILVEENLAQETGYESSGESAWPEVPQRSQQHKKESEALKNLDQLEQQLVMSGFSYLLNPCNEQKPEFTYETTTISSSYCTYKGNKEPPIVSSSSSIPNFAANKDRSPQSQLSTRPHLASPGEFMTSSKSPFGKEAVSGFLQEESHSRQDASKSLPGNTDSSQHNPWFNTWSQHDWKLPQDKNKSLFGSSDVYSSEGRTLADLSFKDPKSAGTTLQYHLDGPSAFHDPKYKQQQPVMGPFTVTSQPGDVFRTQSNPQQQGTDSFTKPQLPTNNSKDKTTKTELSWQKWKFQRNIKKLFEKTQSEDVDVNDVGLEIGTLINNSKLSQNFEGISEVMVVLEMITERVLEKTGFSSLAAKICSLLSGLGIPQFTRYMCEVITAIKDDLGEHQTISDWEERCERFCSFMGEMVVIAAGQECTDANFKSVIDILISQSLEKWITLDKVADEKLDEYLICFIALLEVIGPVMEEHNLRFGNFDLETIFNSVRDHVLSDDIPRSAKSALLDLMLQRAAGWPEKPLDKDTVDDDDDIDNVSVENEEYEQDWDPYSKVSAMLEKLKLEDLFKKFKDNRIRDTLLVANKDEFKKTLQEAGFPPGVILEIQMFLEKGEEVPERKRSTSSNKGFPLPARNTTSRKHNHSEHHNQNTEKLEKPIYHEQTCVPPRKSPECQPSKHVSNDNDHRLKQELTKAHYQVHDQPRKLSHDHEEAHNHLHEQAHYQVPQQSQKQGHDQVHEKVHYQARKIHEQEGDRAHEKAHYETSPKQGRYQANEHTHYQAPLQPHRQGLDQGRYQGHNQGHDQTHEQAHYQGLDQGRDQTHHQARDQDIGKRKQTAVTEQRHFGQENEENKGTIREAHNLFEPSYLSRPPPLRVDPASFEYEPEQESPGHEGPMSYSAVLKAKNEDSFPEPPNRSMAVKLTALTKANTAENIPTQSKQQFSKTASKETNKDSGASRREPGPRPPPGLPPLPPQNWGQSPEIRLTVLPNARRGKPDDAAISSETEAWRGRQGFGSPPRASGGRGGASPRGRQEGSRGLTRASNEWQQGRSEPLSWRRLDNEKATREEQLVRPFGPGGQKACFTCGSKEHMSCNDNSKLFFD